MVGHRGRGHMERVEAPSAEGAAEWFAARVADGWFVAPPTVAVDRDEITVVGALAPPGVEPAGGPAAGDPAAAGAAAGGVAPAAAEAGRIRRFREETREARIVIAREAEARYGRKVAWGASAGGTTELFTTLSVPVMTRLRQPERQVLDTLVDAGVARSRSDALAWCVRLVGENADEWLGRLREAMLEVQRVRAQGPGIAS
jgi:hypothetical protein